MQDPRNDFETVYVDGMPVYYGGDFDDSDCEENHDPVGIGLSPETVRGNDIVLPQLEEKCQTNTFAVLHLILSDLSAELGPMDIEGLPPGHSDHDFRWTVG